MSTDTKHSKLVAGDHALKSDCSGQRKAQQQYLFMKLERNSKNNGLTCYAKSPVLHHFPKSLPQLLKKTKAYLSVYQHVWGFISHPIAALPIIISLCHVPRIWSAFERCTVKGKSGFSKTLPQVSFLLWWLMDPTFYQHVTRITVCPYSTDIYIGAKLLIHHLLSLLSFACK